METFGASLAHEVNNPLSYIIFNTDYVSERVDELRSAGRLPANEAEELKSALADALEGAVRIRDVVDELRSIFLLATDVP